MDFELLVFDLDGTLIDSELDLAHSVNAVRASMGLDRLEIPVIATYVGDGAPMLIRRALGPDASDSAVEQGLAFFLRYYGEHMLDNTVLYPGVAESLDAFRAAGLQMAVLTNKPERFSQRIISGLELDDHFFAIFGGNTFETKKPDPEGLLKLIDQAGASRETTLMVGDSSVDILTARNGGTASCGVTYGLRPESLDQHPPDMLVDSMPELATRIGVQRRRRPEGRRHERAKRSLLQDGEERAFQLLLGQLRIDEQFLARAGRQSDRFPAGLSRHSEVNFHRAARLAHLFNDPRHDRRDAGLQIQQIFEDAPQAFDDRVFDLETIFGGA